MNLLTPKQIAVLDAIKQYIKTNEYSPSVREPVDFLCIKSTQSIHKHLDFLRAHGLVEWENKKTRTLRVVQP